MLQELLDSVKGFKRYKQWRNFRLWPPANQLFEGPLPYLGRAVAARGFLAPGDIDHFGAPLPSPPLPSTPFRSTGL